MENVRISLKKVSPVLYIYCRSLTQKNNLLMQSTCLDGSYISNIWCLLLYYNSGTGIVRINQIFLCILDLGLIIHHKRILTTFKTVEKSQHHNQQHLYPLTYHHYCRCRYGSMIAFLDTINIIFFLHHLTIIASTYIVTDLCIINSS